MKRRARRRWREVDETEEPEPFIARACPACGSAIVVAACSACGGWFVVCDCFSDRVAFDRYLSTAGRCPDCRDDGVRNVSNCDVTPHEP